MTVNSKIFGMIPILCFAAGFSLHLAGGELPNLVPIQTLDLGQCGVYDPKSPGFHVNDFATTDSGIFAIVIPGKSVAPFLVHIDLQGKCLGAAPLKTPRGTHLAVSQSGNYSPG